MTDADMYTIIYSLCGLQEKERVRDNDFRWYIRKFWSTGSNFEESLKSTIKEEIKNNMKVFKDLHDNMECYIVHIVPEWFNSGEYVIDLRTILCSDSKRSIEKCEFLFQLLFCKGCYQGVQDGGLS